MPLSEEQVKELKKQLSEQIQNLPEDQKTAAQEQIDSMSSEAIEAMLEQQKSQKKTPVFRMIIEGKMPSTKVGENSEAIAVLDILPISRGHTIIIPKDPAKTPNQLSQETLNLSKEIAGKIISNLKAKTVEFLTETKFEEVIINVIPVYDKEPDMNSPREQASEEELKKVAEIISQEEKEKTETISKKTKKPVKKEVIKLNRKIP